ncbi:MAG: hypothetical protein M5U32_18360 [Myxococcota bacterium]|nr:hypothetical protein [Myxococcota bacterium]
MRVRHPLDRDAHGAAGAAGLDFSVAGVTLLCVEAATTPHIYMYYHVLVEQ